MGFERSFENTTQHSTVQECALRLPGTRRVGKHLPVTLLLRVIVCIDVIEEGIRELFPGLFQGIV
jgi:hypothetical protein